MMIEYLAWRGGWGEGGAGGAKQPSATSSSWTYAEAWDIAVSNASLSLARERLSALKTACKLSVNAKSSD